MTDAHFEKAAGKSAANALQTGAESGCTAMKSNQQTPSYAESCGVVQASANPQVVREGLLPIDLRCYLATT